MTQKNRTLEGKNWTLGGRGVKNRRKSLDIIYARSLREKNHQTSKVWAFWACQSAAQTKSIYVEKNVAWSLSS